MKLDTFYPFLAFFPPKMQRRRAANNYIILDLMSFIFFRSQNPICLLCVTGRSFDLCMGSWPDVLLHLKHLHFIFIVKTLLRGTTFLIMRTFKAKKFIKPSVLKENVVQHGTINILLSFCSVKFEFSCKWENLSFKFLIKYIWKRKFFSEVFIWRTVNCYSKGIQCKINLSHSNTVVRSHNLTAKFSQKHIHGENVFKN